MSPKEDNAGVCKRRSALNSNLPKVAIQGQHDAGFGFREVQKDGILPSTAIGSSPQYIIPTGAEHLNQRFRKVLVS